MDVFLSLIMVALGTASLVLGVTNFIQEDKHMEATWSLLFLGTSSCIWDWGMALFTLQTDAEGAAFWRSIYLIGAFGVIVSAGFIVSIWLNIPRKARRIANIYLLIGAIISYPLLRVPEACTFIRTAYGMSYTPEHFPGVAIYIFYLIGYVLLMGIEIGYCLLKHTRKREVIIANACILVLSLIGISLAVHTFSSSPDAPAIPSSVIIQSLDIIYIYHVKKDKN